MAQRTCDVDGCERKHVARGMCCVHYNKANYTTEQRHPKVTVLCDQCGVACQKRKGERRFANQFCSYDCRTEWRRANGGAGKPRTRSKLPADHPVRVEMARQKEARRRKPPRVEWRTPRECPGCGGIFCPLQTPTAVHCSRRCMKRMERRKRRLSDSRLGWVWSEFMRVAIKFDFRCAYCGVKPPRLDPDHVVPLSKGGPDSVTNLLPACAMCNSSKNAMSLTEWAAWRETRGMPPVKTTWDINDARYQHLTHALLAA